MDDRISFLVLMVVMLVCFYGVAKGLDIIDRKLHEQAIALKQVQEELGRIKFFIDFKIDTTAKKFREDDRAKPKEMKTRAGEQEGER